MCHAVWAKSVDVKVELSLEFHLQNKSGEYKSTYLFE